MEIIIASAIAHQLFKVSNINQKKQEKFEIRKLLANELSLCKDSPPLVNTFTKSKVDIALKAVKNGKAAGVDGILPEFQNNLGVKGRNWLAKLKTNIANFEVLSKLWNEAKSVVYDTVWKRGLLFKLANIVRYSETVRLLKSMLSNRKFRVYLNGAKSPYKYLQNGLPKGSVLSPLFFNIYTADLAMTEVRKFIYADNIALVYQADYFNEIESVLNRDLTTLQKYFRKWYLTLNPNKTIAIVLHLNNREANRKLELKIGKTPVANSKCPRYLGIKIDRSLTFKDHRGKKEKL
ncbi:Reverse transcriptase domain [Cinara cedri]|uniref:Reverse transcriptase domain n=1 Tax=Cinara cedri TaxID=506608 RepID=A0A5E4ME76_9HEMI|nr:Reverse transcriptase domain [Cinara cedri]